MKKIVAVTLLFALICVPACGANENTENTGVQEITSVSTDAVGNDKICVDNTVKFSTLDAFLSSDLADAMMKEGFPVMTVSYDESRFELQSVTAQMAAYTYYLRDHQEDIGVYVNVISNDDIDALETYINSDAYSKNSLFQTLQKDGNAYTVFFGESDSLYSSEEHILCYSMQYIPQEKYAVYISTQQCDNMDLLQEYFDAFTLTTDNNALGEERE